MHPRMRAMTLKQHSEPKQSNTRFIIGHTSQRCALIHTTRVAHSRINCQSMESQGSAERAVRRRPSDTPINDADDSQVCYAQTFKRNPAIVCFSQYEPPTRRRPRHKLPVK